MSTPCHSRLKMGRLSLLAVLTAAALFVSAPGVGLAVDDDGAVDDGLTNEIDESDLGEGDELVEWGEDVEVWGERPDGSKFVPEVLPVVDYYAKAMSVSVEETKRRFAIEDAAGAFKRSLPRSWETASWECGSSTSPSSGCSSRPSPLTWLGSRCC